MLGDLGNRVPEPFRILLGREHGNAERRGTLHQHGHRTRDPLVLVQDGAIGLLHVDDDDDRGVAVEEPRVTGRSDRHRLSAA